MYFHNIETSCYTTLTVLPRVLESLERRALANDDEVAQLLGQFVLLLFLRVRHLLLHLQMQNKLFREAFSEYRKT